jgi:hypothetical protein
MTSELDLGDGVVTANAGARCAERRERVLRYPDLAKRLTERPVGYARPDQWNGFVPPATVNAGSYEEVLHAVSGRPNGKGRRACGQAGNDSPRRAALVAVAAEAWRREQAGEAAP